MKHGVGKITFPNGWNYEGQWSYDVIQGEGTLIQKNKKYIGEFKDNKKNGRGTLTYENSSKSYNGSFKNDKFDGKGILTFENGSKYQGSFIDGKQHGKGIFIS